MYGRPLPEECEPERPKAKPRQPNAMMRPFVKLLVDWTCGFSSSSLRPRSHQLEVINTIHCSSSLPSGPQRKRSQRKFRRRQIIKGKTQTTSPPLPSPLSQLNQGSACTMPYNDAHSSSSVGVLHSGNKIHKPELIKKIGGADVLKQAVNNFYDRLTVDPQIRVYFQGANLEVLRWHQFNLMSIAFHDIPVGFDIRDLILKRHVTLFDAGLDGKTYDLVLEHFCETLRELNVPEDAIKDALQIVKPYRDIFEEGAFQATQRKKKTERRELMLQLALVAATVYVGFSIFSRRRK